MLNRVTQNQMADAARGYLTRQASELFKIQQQVSSGLKIQKPSDDPTGMRRALLQKDRVERLQTHSASIAGTRSRLEQAQSRLLEVNQLLTKAKGIALQASQVNGGSESATLVAELNSLLTELSSLANSSDESGYLFSGTAISTMPFPGSPLSSTQPPYAGQSVGTDLFLTGDAQRATLLPGDVIFQPLTRGPSLIFGRSGVTPGTGTDTAKENKTIQIVHGITSFEAGSGVARGIGSNANDTIVGPSGANYLTINDTSGTGAFGTISLNGGTPTAYTNTDTSLVVTGPSGEIVHLRTTGITPGFNGNVDVAATGQVSIDDGQTWTYLNWGTNQRFTDSRDGSIVHLNTSGVRITGINHIEFPGTDDIFSALRQLRDDIGNTRDLSPSALQESLGRRLAEIERVQEHVLEMVGVHAVSLAQIDHLQSYTGNMKLSAETDYQMTVSADLAGAVLRLQELTSLQQFTMAAVGRMMQPDLLNFLR